MSLTFESAGGAGVCPPEETYTLQIAKIGKEWVERENFNDKSKIDLNADITFKVVDVPADFDEDERDTWIGFEFNKYYRKPGRISDDRGALNNLICAALSVAKLTDDDTFNADELIGKKFMADIEPTASGYPKIARHRPLKKKAKAAPKPVVVEDEDDEDFPE